MFRNATMQQHQPDNTLYETLGVPRSASESDIKKAYVKLSLVHHPDKGGNNEQFQRINAAYEVLKDAEKRRIYDAVGLQGLQEQQQQTAANAAQQSAANEMFSRMFGGGGAPPMFFQFGAGGAGFTFNMHQQQQGPPQEAEIVRVCDVTLEHVYQQKPIFLDIDVRKRKPSSAGGVVLVHETQKFKLQFKAWSDLQRQILFRGKGHESADGRTQTGDVVVRLNLVPHPFFTPCNTHDLLLKHTLTLEESLCGFSFILPFLDSAKTMLQFASKIDEVVAAGTTYKAACGLPLRDTTASAFDASKADYGAYGAMIVVLDVQTPASMNKEQRARLASKLTSSAERVAAPPPSASNLVKLERTAPVQQY